MEEKRSFRAIISAMVRFSLPLILSGVLQQLYSWADAFVVGNVAGEASLAAIGAASTPVNLFVTGVTGFALGLSVLAARYWGIKDRKKLAQLLSVFGILLGSVYAIIAAVSAMCAQSFLLLLHTPAEIISEAGDYMMIVSFGFPFLAIYNVCTAWLRGLENSGAAFFSILLSSVVNIVLDLHLVVRCDFGVRGAAIATVVSQAAMTIFIIIYTIARYAWLKAHMREGALDRSVLRAGMRFGIPSMLQACINSIGGLALQDFMNRFGTQTVTAITTAYRIDTLVLLPITNLSAGISTMTACSDSAGDQIGVRRIHGAGIVLAAAVSLALSAAVIPTGGRLIALFGAGSAAVAIGSAFFRRIACFYPIYGLSMAYRGLLEGYGKMLCSSMIGIVTLGLRIAASYAMADRFGNMSIAYAEMLSWVVRLAMYCAACVTLRRRKKI